MRDNNIFTFDKRGRKLSFNACQKMGGNTRFKAIHGMRNSVEYRIWQDMLNRCRNKNVDSYKNYGERGIKVCKRWETFQNFIQDIGKRPSSEYSIERINSDGNYEPNNVKWELKIKQSRNRKNTRNVIYKGKDMKVSEWAERLGIKRDTLYKRIFIYKWDLEKALSL